jgi:carbon-monoxide dehydrogenase medium subunit
MTPFVLTEPATLAEAVALLDPDDPSVRPIAGGTGLMLMMKAGVFRPERLVSLRRVEPRWSQIASQADGGLRIGALTPLATIEHAPEVRRLAPVIGLTMLTLSNVRVRNVATLGGALAHGDPHMDLPPVMIALDAIATVIGPAGQRHVPVEDLFVGYYETVLKGDELISEVVIPPQTDRRAVYLKCTTRAAHDWPALGVAVSVDTAEGRSARIVLSAATEKAVRASAAEDVLGEGALDPAAVRRAAEAAADTAELIGDAQGSVPYKRELVRVYVERAVRRALGLDGSVH